MSKTGSIILVEDDLDDQEMIQRAIRQLALPNEIKMFRDGDGALLYLKSMTEQPFIIVCDINMPGMDGLTLKKQIDSNPPLRARSIPFVYLTTVPTPNN
jgi:CheY-like chemotaxis protein